jgi:predicted anti-sigma-YlaC factor YlaD
VKKDCDEIQGELLDLFEQEMKIPLTVEKHLLHCSDCDAFYRKLQQLQEELQIKVVSEEVDNRLILRAMDEGMKVSKRRESLFSNLGFLFVIITVFTILRAALSSGMTEVLLGLQVLLVFLGPLLIPLVIRKQLKGGVK